MWYFFFFQAEDGIRDYKVTGVQTCALPICQENPFNTVLSSKFYEVQKYLTVSNHVYSPWIVTVSKKWWDTLSPAEKKVLQDAAVKSREFERKDTREEAAKALADIKAKGDRKSVV